MKQGLTHIYTGDGKGKTTAAVGQTIRAAGQGLRCCFIFFFKDLSRYTTGELTIMKTLGITVMNFVSKSPCFSPDVSHEEMRQGCLQSLKDIEEKIFSDKTLDLLVLDEFNLAVKHGYLTEKDIFPFIQKKPAELELILTGRGATDELMEQADYVSQIHKIKHPYERDIQIRKGIEY